MILSAATLMLVSLFLLGVFVLLFGFLAWVSVRLIRTLYRALNQERPLV